ncbi:MAG: hypothetical protein AAF725_12220, partial [Acidobacteriota bacterium]
HREEQPGGANPMSAVLASAEAWQQLPAGEKRLGQDPFLSLVSVQPGTSVVLEAEDETAIETADPWLRDLVRDSRRLSPDSPRGSAEWLDGDRAWAVMWDASVGTIAAYSETRADGWRSSTFRRRVSRLVLPLLQQPAEPGSQDHGEGSP